MRNKKFIWLIFGVAALIGCQRNDFFISGSNYPPPTPLTLDIPSNLPELTFPHDNPLTEEGVALGRRLFYDPILSGDSTQSCASCHRQKYAFSDSTTRFSTGIDGIVGNMNAMTIINPGWGTEFFWDGRAGSLELQAGMPVENPIEMHETWENNLVKLKRHPSYPEWFGLAFGDEEITRERAEKAIAQFERTFISANSLYDKFRRHEVDGNFNQSQFNGYIIFFTEKGDCFHCHSVGLLSDNLFHNNGLDSVLNADNMGYYKTTGDAADWGKFKTPSLRNIALSAPYMHDGRFATLEEVVEHYNSGVHKTNTLDPLIKKPDGLFLSDQEKTDLVNFLHTLTDSTFLKNPDLGNPW